MSDPWCGRRVAERFDIVALLGKGAMGAVYRARDVVAGRDVALKVLLGHRLQQAHRARFRREGEVTAALHHPGIVRVYSAGELPGNIPFLAYELIDGARTELGSLYDKGAPGVPQDFARALELYERHNRMEDRPHVTLIRTGELLRDGAPGVPRDDARAVARFERAHAIGSAIAARELALMLREGRGAPKDEARAVALLETAVAAGEHGSILRLGEMYATGSGVARDVEKARALFKEADRKKVPGAREALRTLNGR